MKPLKSDLRTLSLSVLLLLVMLLACDVSVATNNEKVVNEVTARLAAFAESINGADTGEMIDFYSNSERFYWVEDGEITYDNTAAVKEAIGGLYTTIEKAEMRVLDTRIEVLANDRVNIYSEYEQDMTMKSGFAFSINGAMTALMENEAGTWRFVIGHSSTKKER